MSSTVRAYMNNKRVATAKPWGTQFLQVYPEQKTFASEAEWRSHLYQNLMNSLHFEVEKVEQKEVKVEVEKKVVKQEKKETENWTCGYCRLPSGNDHRRCIIDGYNYNVVDWENDRRFPKPEKKAAAPAKKEGIDTAWCFNKKTSVVLPAGEYYIGDLCYALKHNLYDTVFGPRYELGHYWTFRPNEAFMVGGYIDDGSYRGSDRKVFEVDAGIIGIASMATLDPAKAPYSGGHMYTFKSPIHVRFHNNKFNFFGEHYEDPHLSINIYEDFDTNSEESE